LRQTVVAEALGAGMEMPLHLLATLNVGCGSLADISAPPANVRFTPEMWASLSIVFMSALCQ
jgi:hypothetical protein